MSDRDELVAELWEVLWPGTSSVMHDEELRAERVQVNRIMSAVWAAGWRKMPSRGQLTSVFIERGGLLYAEASFLADAILALMDGGSDE